MNSSANILDSICADTIRYYETNIQNPINYGLECYLGETILKSGKQYRLLNQEINRSLSKLMCQAQLFYNCNFWGWEKKASISGVTFPLDWDDTSKAIDFIRMANKQGIISNDALSAMNLPSEIVWNKLIENSLFNRFEIGEDILIPCSFSDSLTVFFGPGAEKLKMRDDSMVSIVTVRTTYIWYNNVFLNLKDKMLNILNRGIFTLNKILETNYLNFSSISRYYFSFGHYVFILLETISFTGCENRLISINYKLLYSTIHESLTKITVSKIVNIEDLWFCLIGIKLNIIQYSEEEFILSLTKIDDNVPIFRHRRLNHYYGSNNWHKRMLLYEYKANSKL